MDQDKFRQLDPIFHPKSIAVVGASRNRVKPGTRFLEGLLQAGFTGKIYPVNLSGEQILGLKSYPTVDAIPDLIDYVIISIPARAVLEVLQDCARKRVKAVQLFTAGFRETGRAEGARLEEEIARQAREGGFRVIGPNCIGIYNPSLHMPCGPSSYMGSPGEVAFLSQSGGHALGAIKAGIARGLGFSKVVSFGNGCDLNAMDYLEYFALDPETRLIAAYLEGVADGSSFLKLVKEIVAIKPLIIWKGGQTPAGAEVAASHTGVLAIPDAIWDAALKQCGALAAESLDEVIDTLLALSRLGWARAHNIGIISGLVDGGGGDSVAATDLCTHLGIKIPPFTAVTRASLQELLPPAGAILRNPLDIGATASDWQLLGRVIEQVMADPQIDLVIMQQHVDDLVSFLGEEGARKINETLIALQGKLPKPLIVISSPGLAEPVRLSIEKDLSAAGIPVYPSLERAARVLARLRQYAPEGETKKE